MDLSFVCKCGGEARVGRDLAIKASFIKCQKCRSILFWVAGRNQVTRIMKCGFRVKFNSTSESEKSQICK